MIRNSALALALVGMIVSAITLAQHPSPKDPLSFRADIVDSTQNPCSDFYQYACNTWMKTHPIPADRSAWDPYYQLAEKNDEAIHRILEGKEGDNSAANRKVRDYYTACMDEAQIEQVGLSPLAQEFNRILVQTPCSVSIRIRI